MSDYQLDTKAAAAADVIFAKIEVTGKYLGTLTRAEPVTSAKGTKGVDMSFKSDDGAAADYLTLWTHDKDGTQLPDFKILMAIMTCLRVKTLTAEDGEIEKWDKEQSKRVKVKVKLFKELMAKPLGLLIQMEEYINKKGSSAWSTKIHGAFDKDGFTASEILSKVTKAEVLDKMVAALKDKPMKNSTLPVRQDGVMSENPGHGMGGGSFVDDDVPFAHHGKCGAGVSWRAM